MRILTLVLALAAAAGAQTTPSATPKASPTATPAATAQGDSNWLPPLKGDEDASQKKARALLTQMIEALGGQAYMNITDSTSTGRTYSISQGSGMAPSVGFAYRLYTKFPDKDRLEVSSKKDVHLMIATIPAGTEGFLVYIGNGDKGYEITYKGTTVQEPTRWREQVRQRQHSLARVLRLWLKDPRTLILYEGTALAEQRMTDKISILNGDNDSVTLFIDQNSHLPLKKTYAHRNPDDRMMDEEGEIFGGYRVIDGINTPFSIVQTHNGEYRQQRFLSSMTYNTGLQDSLFQATPTYDPYALERRLDQQKQQQQNQH